jgi:hypothetical protein
MAETALWAVKALARAFYKRWPKRPFGPLKPWPGLFRKDGRNWQSPIANFSNIPQIISFWKIFSVGTRNDASYDFSVRRMSEKPHNYGSFQNFLKINRWDSTLYTNVPLAEE